MKRPWSMRLALLSVLLGLACQPTHGFRFLNPSSSRRVVKLLESSPEDTSSLQGNAACVSMRSMRSPLGTTDTLHIMPDSSRTWMIAFGANFSPSARYCLIASRQGGRDSDTLFITGETALARSRGGVLTVRLYPALAIVDPPSD